jgi:GTP-binding protein
MAVVAIVGRPNVGKSTLFNRLIGGRAAIVDDIPGVTRDRNYGEVEWGRTHFTLVDTGGFEEEAAANEEAIVAQVRLQVEAAIAEADAVVLVCDGRQGLTPLDEEMMRRLRRTQKPVLVAVNKIDTKGAERLLPEFYALGVERLYPVSAAHGLGVWELADDVVAALPPPAEEPAERPAEVRVAVVGRPNVGKSSLINRVLGYERVVVSERPGTTRDAVDTRVELDGQPYVLVDTAGIRRKGKLSGRLEHYGLLRALRAMERADVCLLLIDAAEGLTDQDMKIAAQAYEMGRGVVVALNKWDLLGRVRPREASARRESVREGLQFLGRVPLVATSATEGTGLTEIFQRVAEVNGRLSAALSTSELNRALEAATTGHEPPSYRGRRVKLYYITQVGARPLRFVVFANYPKGVTDPYRRYLTNQLRARLELESVPVQLIFKPRRKET